MVPPLVARMHNRIEGMVAALNGSRNARKHEVGSASGGTGKPQALRDRKTVGFTGLLRPGSGASRAYSAKAESRSNEDYRGAIRTVPLILLGKGRRGRVARIEGGPKSLRRLADLGLTRGTKVTVMHSAPIGGTVRVAVRGTSIALGKGVASRVFVKIEGK